MVRDESEKDMSTPLLPFSSFSLCVICAPVLCVDVFLKVPVFPFRRGTRFLQTVVVERVHLAAD